MTSFDWLANMDLSVTLADSAGQMMFISIMGISALMLLRRKSAPVRSLAAAGILLSMLGVFILSVVFHTASITWYKADISRLSPKSSIKMTTAITAEPMHEAMLIPDIRIENTVPIKPTTSVEFKTKPARTFKITAVHCINTLGLLWAGGIVFMLLKLGYGLAFIRGFRFGLNRISDEKINRLLKTTAALFNKQRTPELYTSSKVESPITIGLINQVVIIPEKLFSTLSENELKSILLHELAHIYHYDHLIGIIKRIVIAVNWWNPLVYRISAKHTIAREEVADNYVLQELKPLVYSECLAGLAEKICLISNLPSTAGMAGNYSSLEHRVKNILSKKRKLTMTTGLFFKLTTVTVCVTLTLFAAGVQGQIEAKPATATVSAQETAKADVTAANTTYQISGTIPAELSKRTDIRGEAVFSQPKGFPPVAKMAVQPDADGKFNITYPADSSNKGTLRVKVSFTSELYAPVEAISKVTPGKPVTLHFSPPLMKSEAVHYFGVLLDEISNAPVPYVGIYSDSQGTEIGRADENGHFDLYVKPLTQILPWLASDQYAGHSYFFKHKAGESVELKLIMERGVRVRVHTVDEKGVPVPGVFISWMGGGGASGTTDTNGDALLSGMLSRVRPGQLVEVRKQGYELAQNPGELHAILYTDKPLQIVMRRVESTFMSRFISSQNNSKVSTEDSKKSVNILHQEKVRKRIQQDSQIYSQDELRTINTLFFDAAKEWGTDDAREKLKTLITKYPKSIQAEWGLLYLGRMSKGDEQIKYLQRCIDEFNDCVYGDGVQVGPYARYCLAEVYTQNGEKEKAAKLIEEIKTNYPDAVDHGGKKLIDIDNKTIEKMTLQGKAWKKIQADEKIYSKNEFREIVTLYGSVSQKWGTEEAITILKTLIAKYPKSNRTGCALLYLGQLTSGEEQIKYLQQAIDGYSDCFYGDGVQVGAYARYYLASVYNQKGEDAKATKLFDEIKAAYPDAIDHGANSLIAIITVKAQKQQGKRRMQDDAKIYSKTELNEIENLYLLVCKKWNTEEAKESLKTLLAKYPKSNRTGCALLYMGQMSKGLEQIKYLQQASKRHC